jgi:filamentous hemagglutinin
MTGNRIKRLTSNMKKEGFDSAFPIVAAEVEDRLIIVDGHHRAQAAIRAGIGEVPVRVAPVNAEQAAELAADAAEAAGQRGLSWR